MPSPSSSLATLRPDLAGSFMEFELEMQQRGYIAHRVLPIFETLKQAGKFGKIPIEQLLQKRETKRAPGGGYSRGNWTFTDDSFTTEEHGAEEPIDDREVQMYADYFDAEQVSAARAFEAVLQSAEQRAAALLFNTTTWTGAALTTAVGTPWSTVASAVPLTDVEAAVQKVWENCGMWPNALILNKKVYRNLRRTAQIIDLVKYSGFMDTRAGAITEEAIKQCFDLEYLFIAGNVKNTANEGAAASLSPIWGSDKAMVAKVCVTNDIREPGVGRTFHWSEDGSSPGGTIETYRDERVRGDVVRVRHEVDEKVLYVEAAHLLTGL